MCSATGGKIFFFQSATLSDESKCDIQNQTQHECWKQLTDKAPNLKRTGKQFGNGTELPVLLNAFFILPNCN